MRGEEPVTAAPVVPFTKVIPKEWNKSKAHQIFTRRIWDNVSESDLSHSSDDDESGRARSKQKSRAESRDDKINACIQILTTKSERPLLHDERRRQQRTNSAKEKLEEREVRERKARAKFHKSLGKRIQKVNKRVEEQVVRRRRNYEATIYRMAIFERWGFENDERRDKDEEAARRNELLLRQRNQEELDRKKERELRRGKAKEWRDTHELTEQIVTMMRRAGVTPGVGTPSLPTRNNSPPKDPNTDEVLLVKRPIEPSSTIQTTCNDTRTTSTTSLNHKTNTSHYFTINLHDIPATKTIKAHKIGHAGAAALALDLRHGACPNVRHISLGWNDVRLTGFQSLCRDALAADHVGKELASLDLRANHIPGKGIASLRDALSERAAGGVFLPQLARLDLRHNPLGCEGAKLMAHVILSGGMARLEILDVSDCLIRDGGMKALNFLFHSEYDCRKGMPVMMPRVRCVNLRDNRPTPKFMRSCSPWAWFVQV
mmetsp:Transcript_14135/g.17799  ORF Transcript_14135/g.17799 Transcript_14135/m.17799 type:complete len:488 (-) Transcript_14135:250-1713(-)|eukprot:CAMPEP_0172482302 /NCGR_PEP_ID=MMETSP1066-20121228/8617_1 /TAXON_ID=671091 /ORGANISM="Coscinodiscus wailesii, Strain CCMP2513" /LENGTH=487 /DNA_ID=CAMNT_0013245305 /DNA_START=199 /DNA_END=1662 /DNA_ORIENTATION=+